MRLHGFQIAAASVFQHSVHPQPAACGRGLSSSGQSSMCYYHKSLSFYNHHPLGLSELAPSNISRLSPSSPSNNSHNGKETTLHP